MSDIAKISINNIYITPLSQSSFHCMNLKKSGVIKQTKSREILRTIDLILKNRLSIFLLNLFIFSIKGNTQLTILLKVKIRIMCLLELLISLLDA